MSYLSEFHPEVFLAAPRPGGLANILPPSEIAANAGGTQTERRGSKTTLVSSSRSARSTATAKSILDSPMFTSTPKGQVSRDFRIRTTASSSPWILFDDEEEADSTEPPNPIHDTMKILAITITTIMLMAAEHSDISAEHYKWALSYLENVRDEYGNYPPNIRGIINNIKMVDDSIESYNEGLTDPSPDPPEPAEE